jgi:Ca2+-binding EF-hand superfamily protein
MADSDKVEFFLKKYDDACATSGKTTLDLAGFKALFAEVLGDPNEEVAEIYFHGIDIDDSKEIDRAEFKEFVIASLKGDRIYALKMVFRAFDRDRSRTLDADEIKLIAKQTGATMDDADIDKGMLKMTGKKNGTLKYAQVVKLLTGQDVPADSDPYDGKLKSSSCCLLL